MRHAHSRSCETSGFVRSVVVTLLAGAVPVAAPAQQPASPSAVMFDGVTVVDVEQGKLLPDQRVVIAGNRIRTVGAARAVKAPAGAHVVDARGKYLIPGLWDMHVHGQSSIPAYSVLLANGITGIRDASTAVPLDTLRLWRREVLAGKLVGPPRQIFSGPGVSNEIPDCQRSQRVGQLHTCVTADPADQRHFVDSLKAAGADMIKLREIDKSEVYFVMANHARRIGLPVGGQASMMTAVEASDSGATIIDHLDQYIEPSLSGLCNALRPSASVEQCKPVADQLRRNGTWLIPTARDQIREKPSHTRAIVEYLRERRFTFDSLRVGGWLRNFAPAQAGQGRVPGSSAFHDSLGALHIMQHVGMPIIAGTDRQAPPLGLGELHVELAIFVAEGLTPLSALQAATLNPTKVLHATDSLGTIANGKLADLVLLDANPLADITNTATIRAVVANGRYFDRAALDRLLESVRTNVVVE